MRLHGGCAGQQLQAQRRQPHAAPKQLPAATLTCLHCPVNQPPTRLPQGPSGSGKTTLLDLLAGRKTTGRTKGDILFAGNKPTRPFLRRYTGYVEQFDTLLPILTVEEMLMYTAELKRPRSESRADKRAAVEVSCWRQFSKHPTVTPQLACLLATWLWQQAWKRQLILKSATWL